MKNMKIYSKLLKMMFLKNYCTDFMFLMVMLCGTYSSTMLSPIVFNFLIVFKLSLLFVEIYVFMFRL